MTRDIEELVPVGSDDSVSPRPPRWLGIGAASLAIGVLFVALGLIREAEPATPTSTTLAEVALPDMLIAGPDGVFSTGSDEFLTDECAVKAVADRLGGLVLEACRGDGLVHLTSHGTRRQLVFDSAYHLDSHYEQAPQPGAVVMALGDRGLGDSTSTFVYLTGSETHLSVIMPSYQDFDFSQERETTATVGIDREGATDDGCLVVESPNGRYESGCGPESIEVTMAALHPFDDRVAFVTVDAAGNVVVTVVDVALGTDVSSFDLEAEPIDLDFTGNWLAIVFDTGEGAVTRVFNLATYYFEDVSGFASFQRGPIIF